MAETNAYPTDDEISAIRADICNYVNSSDEVPKVLQDYSQAALALFKNDLEDMRNIKFVQVFDTTNDEYFSDTDDYTRNLNKIRKEMLCYLSIALVFRDYVLLMQQDGDGVWFNQHLYYWNMYQEKLKVARLDVDIDEDGTIDESEEQTSGQRFMRK